MMDKEKYESQHYQAIKSRLQELFSEAFGDKIKELHLEVTASGKFSNKLKNKLSQNRDIIFAFLRSASPDISGFVDINNDYQNSGFVVAEFKNEEIRLDDIYQTRKYAELFDARHAFLISSEEIPEEIKRLAKSVYSLLSLPGYGRLTLCRFVPNTKQIDDWFEKSPFARI